MFSSYKQKIILFYKSRKRMPTYAEIMKLVGFKSKNAAYKLVNKLIEEGALSKDPSGHLIPNRLQDELPLLGLVEAGFPSLAEEQILDTFNFDDYLIKNKESTYILKVKGDSMIDAGIHEGDLVIAEKGREARVGDIVIAEVDGGWTMKYFKKMGSLVYLEPANKEYKPIFAKRELNIAAVVSGVIRKYR
ncbi:MAG: transcriptional repressor LexA [bacterium]|nr:transcriptional repressor LexA [bacterium]